VLRFPATRALALGLVTAPACAVSGGDRFDANSETMEIAATAPVAGGTLADPHGFVDLCLSAIVDPRSVDDGDIELRSGRVQFDAEIAVDLTAWHEPGTDRPGGDSPWCEGSVVRVRAVSGLPAGATVRVELADDLHGWNGERFDTNGPGWFAPDPSADDGDIPPEDFPEESTEPRFSLSFEVAEDSAPVSPPEARSLAELFLPGGVFDPERAMCSCHADTNDPARALLDLRDPQRAHASILTASTVTAGEFPLVVPGRPEASSLIHKLVRDNEGGPLRGLVGAAMPSGGEALATEDLASIATWIRDGALP
jgi:hypothetical protein